MTPNQDIDSPFSCAQSLQHDFVEKLEKGWQIDDQRSPANVRFESLADIATGSSKDRFVPIADI